MKNSLKIINSLIVSCVSLPALKLKLQHTIVADISMVPLSSSSYKNYLKKLALKQYNRGIHTKVDDFGPHLPSITPVLLMIGTWTNA